MNSVSQPRKGKNKIENQLARCEKNLKLVTVLNERAIL